MVSCKTECWSLFVFFLPPIFSNMWYTKADRIVRQFPMDPHPVLININCLPLFITLSSVILKHILDVI